MKQDIAERLERAEFRATRFREALERYFSGIDGDRQLYNTLKADSHLLAHSHPEKQA